MFHDIDGLSEGLEVVDTVPFGLSDVWNNILRVWW